MSPRSDGIPHADAEARAGRGRRRAPEKPPGPRGRRPRHHRGLARPAAPERGRRGRHQVDRAGAHARPRRALPGPARGRSAERDGTPEPVEGFRRGTRRGRGRAGGRQHLRRRRRRSSPGRAWFAGQCRRARAEPLLPPRRGLRCRDRHRPGARRGLHPGRGRSRCPDLGQADAERHGHHRHRQGRGTGRGHGPRRDQHGQGHADLDRPARPVLGNRFGGLSGRAVFPVAVRCVYELDEAVRIPIIGCGGVSSRERRRRDADGRRVRGPDRLGRARRPERLRDDRGRALRGGRGRPRARSWGAPMREASRPSRSTG